MHFLHVSLNTLSTVIYVFMNYKGHIPYCCARLVLMKYVLYDNNIFKSLKTVFSYFTF